MTPPDRDYLWLLNQPVEQRLAVMFVDSPLLEEPPIEVFHVNFYESQLRHDDLIQQVYQSLHDDDTGAELANYVAESKRLHFSWGAEHSVAEALFWIANAAASGYVYDRIKGVLQNLRDQGSANHAPDLEEAVALAKWTIAARYKVDEDGLRLVADDRDEAGVVGLRLENDEHGFDVTVAGREGFTTVIHVRRGALDY